MNYDIAIVGSGFGGAVMAARLGAWAKAQGKTVVVLERGNDHTNQFDTKSNGAALNAQGNRFRHNLDPQRLATLSDLYTDRDGAFRAGTPSMNVIAGRGMGGGSIIYDGVSLRAPTLSLNQTRNALRLWPQLYSRSMLNPYYARVEAMLSVCKLAWTDASAPHWQLATKRDYVFAEGCRRIGAAAAPLKLADLNDANEGWWNEGQRFEGRQDLSKNYLRDAKTAGVTFMSGCDVEHIEPLAAGYMLTGKDTRASANAELRIQAKLVIVAAGAIGSSGILLRSQRRFQGARELSAMLGRELSSNGDYGVSGIVGKAFERDVEGFKGKPMSSFCPTFFEASRFILIPFYTPALYLTLGQPSTLLRAQNPRALGRGAAEVAKDANGNKERDWGLAYKKRLEQFGSRMLTMGCLALDGCEGEVKLAADGRTPEVRWAKTSSKTEETWSLAVDTMRKIYEALGGEMYLDTYRKDGTVNTAHPLGGCRMGESRAAGVVDSNGEVFGNRNLFVVDGGIVPSALGVNPSLTIAAIAESIADRLMTGTGTDAMKMRV
jgi:enediyne biosynthesis protein E9